MPGSRLPRAAVAAALGTATLCAGVGVGALAAARRISGPQRPELDYGFSPFEVGIEADHVTFAAADGVHLAGWWLDRPASDHVVICCHGHRGSKADLLGIGPGLWRAGMSVLLFDFRGNGDSEDGPQSLAHYEQLDLAAALDFVSVTRPGARIDVVGFSMGGAVALLVAAEDPRVRRVVADSAFADLHGVVRAAATSMRLPPVPLVDIVDRVTRLRYGYGFAEVQPVEAIAAIAPRPLLLIHGERDTLIPVENAHRLRAAAGAGARLWLVPEAGHCGAYFVDRPGYIDRVAGFLCEPRDTEQGDAMTKPIHHRDDVDPKDGERAYGDVEFADPVNKKYPIDSAEHVRAAWSYINKKANADKYTGAEVERIKARIKTAAKKHDVEISSDES